MGISTPVAAKANGLSTVVDTIAAPVDAFERQRTSPTWGWALIVAIVLMLIGAYLQAPAAHHAAVAQTQRMVATSTLFANRTDAQKQQIVERAGKPNAFSYIMPVIVLFIAVFFNTVIMLIGNALGRGQADFKRLWCGSMNIAVPTLGLAAIVLGIITMIRGADSFDNAAAMAQAMPSLGMLVSHGSPMTVAFLSGISVFTLWGLFLNATMLRVTAKTGAAAAYTFAALVLVLGALVAAGSFAVMHSFGMS
jgi:MFS family permease